MNTTIYLRPLRIEDAQVSYRWRNDPAIWTYTGSRPSHEITYEIEEKWLIGTFDKKDQMRFAICILETDTYIGNIQLINISNGTADLHLFIGEKSFWGQNIGFESILQLLRIGFLKQQLLEIHLTVHAKHQAAIALYTKAGFEQTGTIEDLISMKISKSLFLSLTN